MNPDFSRGLKFAGACYLAVKRTKQEALFALNGARRGSQSLVVIAAYGRQGGNALLRGHVQGQDGRGLFVAQVAIRGPYHVLQLGGRAGVPAGREDSLSLHELAHELEADPALAERLLRINFSNTVMFCEASKKALLEEGGGALCVFSSVAEAENSWEKNSTTEDHCPLANWSIFTISSSAISCCVSTKLIRHLVVSAKKVRPILATCWNLVEEPQAWR